MSNLDHSPGQEITPDDCTGNTLKLPGNWTGLPLYAGNPYCFQYQISPQYLTAEAGGSRVLIHEGRLQLRNFIVSFTQTQFFKIYVTPDISGTQYEYTFGDDSLLLDTETLALTDDDMRVPVMAKNDQVTVLLENCSPYPSNFLTAAFDAEFAAKARRIG